MKKSAIIKDIIFLPKRFSEGNTSIYALLKESGYFELHNAISEADIFENLTHHLECIDGWLSLSEDKRSSSGWYFKQDDNGKYIVGYFPLKENLVIAEYLDEVEACAAFIKREIEDIRTA
jgi:hypothetical protein